MKQTYKICKKGEYHREDFSHDETGKFKSKAEGIAAMEKNLVKINELQQKLYAEKTEGVIFLFQAMDAAGKDGTIRAVLSCLSPHGVTEHAFKAPTSEERGHDFLWRVAKCAPEKGEMAIFNRSHYEDVLVGKVHSLYKTQPHAAHIDQEEIIERRYKDICNWEEYLYHNSVRIVKIFLNVSKEEQSKRFLSRIEEPQKNWKFSLNDVKEREYWDDYQKAFEDAIDATASEECPWYVVPADHKWYMRYLVSEIILDTLKEMNPQWPTVSDAQRELMQQYKKSLED
ncbi:MAG: PPK2 family polyphosphate kinase [Faecalibacterium sp.]